MFCLPMFKQNIPLLFCNIRNLVLLFLIININFMFNIS